jgi:threonine/homoserine/homoserine lactone efflux protein
VNQPVSADEKHRKRDGETLIALGVFLTVLGVPVILGVLWEPAGLARWVSGISGALLVVAGVAFCYKGRSLLRR